MGQQSSRAGITACTAPHVQLLGPLEALGKGRHALVDAHAQQATHFSLHREVHFLPAGTGRSADGGGPVAGHCAMSNRAQREAQARAQAEAAQRQAQAEAEARARAQAEAERAQAEREALARAEAAKMQERVRVAWD
eukprot:scaffold43614_cov26-Tisochrysis_lutea.AAC.3